MTHATPEQLALARKIAKDLGSDLPFYIREWAEAAALAAIQSQQAEIERKDAALWKIERNEDAAYSRDLARAALNPQPGKESGK